MSNLVMDIITNILSRLPVKSLLLLRSVSKPWLALIDSPNFIKLHLHHSISTNSNLSLILRDEQLYSIDLYSLQTLTELNHHPLINSSTTFVLGSCNGLLLLGNFEQGLAIWNPSTRKFRKLPHSYITPPDYSHYFNKVVKFGLAYDCVSDDYKVVRVVQFYCEKFDSFEFQVKVYSLKFNTWRRISDFPYYLCFALGGGGVLAGGCLHWFVKEKRDPNVPKLIAAFDVAGEEYRLVQEPEYLEGCFQTGLEVLGGCLCVTCSYYKDRLDIWVMKEYGVKESWTRLLSVVPPNIRTVEYMKPLAYSKSGGEVLLDYGHERLIWYDLTGKLIKEVVLEGMPYSFFAEVFVGSLVSLDVYEQGGEDERKGKKKGKKKRCPATGTPSIGVPLH